MLYFNYMSYVNLVLIVNVNRTTFTDILMGINSGLRRSIRFVMENARENWREREQKQ